MKKVLVALFVTAACALTACGANPCDDLKKQCDACTGTAGKASGQAACNLTVTANNADSCKLVVDAKSYASDGALCK